MISDAATFSEYVLVAALFLSLTSIIVTITIAFPKIAEVERNIASSGKQLDGIRVVWGEVPLVAGCAQRGSLAFSYSEVFLYTERY